MKKRSFYRFVFLFIGALTMVSCVKNELQNISENTTVVQDFSVPIISKEFSFIKPDSSLASDIPGLYGSITYDGKLYPNNTPYLSVYCDPQDFNLTGSLNRAKNITFLKFHIKIENQFPTKIYSQITVLDKNYTYYDSIFLNGPIEIAPASVDKDGTLISPGLKIIDIPFEGDNLERLKRINYMFFNNKILTQSTDGSPVKLSSGKVIKLNIATQIQLDYNIKEMFN